MKVTAKMCLESSSKSYSDRALARDSVKLRPVYGDSEENKTWSKWTPAGSLELVIDNPEALALFDGPGEFLVTIERYPVAAPK